MIYRYFDFTFETNISEFSIYLNATDIKTENFYEITYVDSSSLNNGYNLISKKIMGDNRIYYYSKSSGEFVIVHNMIGEYNIDYRSKSIKVLPYNNEYIVPFFLNSVVASMYGYRGTVCLHGCSLLLDNKNVVVVVGDTGAGKSTFSKTILNENNVRLLSDDIVPLFLSENKVYTCYGTNVLKLRDYSDEDKILPVCINDKFIIVSKGIESNIHYRITDVIVLGKRFGNSNEAFELRCVDNDFRKIFLHRFIKERYLLTMPLEDIKSIIYRINNSKFMMSFLQLKDDFEMLNKCIVNIKKQIEQQEGEKSATIF